ncbi:unnamed protein product [Spirodela intermedia]|uniref:Uncharacterized protein n=1 Tax=Spirodela intermedia TaxID=51605 RepID=A0A7I8J7X1_SPIIN|nr:unnamed protein product [Spirodela intermedia]CAA6666174.1 unnamed protein product [Spirodela intermedia]
MAKPVGTYAALAVALVLFVFALPLRAQSPPAALVPAIISFGDSSTDVGNNNYIPAAAFKADFPPYGRNFTTHKPTGRFCDGKLVTDFTGECRISYQSFRPALASEALGFASFPPAYLSPQASGKRLLQGASFASAGSGYYEGTAAIYHALSLAKQMEYYKEYRIELAKVTGKRKAAGILSGAVHLMSFGNGDFFQNYYINSSLRRLYTQDEFSQLLIRRFASFVKDLHGLGARRIGATSLPPVGCLPAPINLFGHGRCISRLNAEAQNFNRKLNATASQLSSKLPGLNLVVLDIFTPLMELITSPSEHGFAEVRKGCCGTGTSRTTVLCKPRREGVCANPEQYVFWDGVHPTQAANQYIAHSLIDQGIALIA